MVNVIALHVVVIWLSSTCLAGNGIVYLRFTCCSLTAETVGSALLSLARHLSVAGPMSRDFQQQW